MFNLLVRVGLALSVWPAWVGVGMRVRVDGLGGGGGWMVECMSCLCSFLPFTSFVWIST